MAEHLVFLELPRGEGEVLRVAVAEYRGRRYADLRVWFLGSHGELRPGKGLTLRPEAIADVIKALRDAARELGVAKDEAR